MKKAFGILLVGLLSMSLEAHSKDASRKVTKPVRIDQNVSIKNNGNKDLNEDFPEQKMIGMANPASVYCVEQGGESIIRKDKDECEFYRQNHDLTEKGVPEINKKWKN